MRAAFAFASTLRDSGLLAGTARVEANLYGSLALTGKGHGTDRAILLGLSGELPDQVDPAQVEPKIQSILSTGTLPLLGRQTVPFNESTDLLFRSTITIAEHPNTMRFTAYDESGAKLREDVYYSVGGGFI